jgi:hypothetical protein
MISPSLNINEFAEHVFGQGIPDLIHLADLEATEAERLFYQKRNGEGDADKLLRYAQTLKDLIRFFRYGIKPRATETIEGQVFEKLCQEISRTNKSQSRCL